MRQSSKLLIFLFLLCSLLSTSSGAVSCLLEGAEVDNSFVVSHSESTDRPNENLVFVRMEVSWLKDLNDSIIGDKAIVDDLVMTAHAQFISYVKSLFPDAVSFQLYRDYKSVIMAMKKEDFNVFNAWMKDSLDMLAVRVSSWLKARGIFVRSKVRDWFSIGFGPSADLAELSARFSRKKDRAIHWDQLESTIKKNIETVWSRTQQLQEFAKNLSSEIGMFYQFNGYWLPTWELMELLRKVKGKEVDEAVKLLSSLIKRRFRHEVGLVDATYLVEFIKTLDLFSLGFYTLDVGISKPKDTRKSLSLDVIGLGAYNYLLIQEEVVREIIQGKQFDEVSIVDLVLRIRYRLINRKIFDQYINGVTEVTQSTFGNQTQVYFSGDDGKIILERNENIDIESFLDGLTRRFTTRSPFRMVLVQGKSEDLEIGDIVSRNENFSKMIRGQLERAFTGKISKKIFILIGESHDNEIIIYVKVPLDLGLLKGQIYKVIKDYLKSIKRDQVEVKVSKLGRVNSLVGEIA